MTQPQEQRTEPALSPLWLLAGILALGFAFRAVGLTDRGLWFDEANGVLFAAAPLAEIPGLLAADSSPPLYYLLLHLWIGLWGDGEMAVRGFSLLCGLLLVAGVYLWGKETAGPATGLWAALYVALSPLATFHAQQARMYALLPLFALLAFRSLQRFLVEEKNIHLLGSALFTAAALYTHNFAFHLLPALGLVALCAGRPRRLLPRVGAAFLLVLLLYLPWLPFFLGQLEHNEHYTWFLDYWNSWSPIAPWRFTILSYSPAGEASMVGGTDSSGFGGWPALAALALAAWGGWCLWRRREALGPVRSTAFPIFLLVPMATALVASHLVAPHYVPARVDQMMLPGFALLAGHGLARLRPAWLAPALAVPLVLVALAGRWRFPMPPPEGFAGSEREAARKVAEDLRPGDMLFCTAYTNRSFEYYLEQAGREARIVPFPGRVPGFWYPAVNWHDEEYRKRMKGLAERLAGDMREKMPPAGRIWFVQVENRKAPFPEMALAALQEKAGFVPVERWGPYLQAGIGLPFWVIRGVPGKN